MSRMFIKDFLSRIKLLPLFPIDLRKKIKFGSLVLFPGLQMFIHVYFYWAPKLKFYRKLGVFDVRLFQVEAFNIEIIYLLIVYRVPWSRDSMKKGKGVTKIDWKVGN